MISRNIILFNYHISSIVSNSSIKFGHRAVSKYVSNNLREIALKNEQMEYINDLFENSRSLVFNWSDLKENVLNKHGVINKNNINAILLKRMISLQKFDPAVSFATHLKESFEELNLGSINGLLNLYYTLGKQGQLSEKDKEFVMDIYKYVKNKYKILDGHTCDSLLHALCVIDKWQICLKLLDDINYTGTPTHSAYSTLIATLFKNNKKADALKLIQTSIDHSRPLQDEAFEEWINYILRKYKDKKTIIKYLDELNVIIESNHIKVNEVVADKLKSCYQSLGWHVNVTKIGRYDGQCMQCKQKLNFIPLTTEEFAILQNIVKEKLIVGNDLFLKSSPKELKRFQDFVASSPQFDVVLDALNISYVVRRGSLDHRIDFLNNVVDQVLLKQKNVLLLGRKHMLKWPKHMMSEILSKTSYFFADDLSQDDPYIISAAILSGQKTDIVSRDNLRGHRFLLGDNKLKEMFLRWQWQHQWMLINNINKGAVLKPPLTFTPYCQKNNNAWHIPFVSKSVEEKVVHDWIPDLHNWLCIRQN